MNSIIDLQLPRYKCHSEVPLMFSLASHGLLVLFIFSAHKMIEKKSFITVDDVEFQEMLEEAKPKKTFDLFKMALPKIVKQEPKIEPIKTEEKIEPLLKDKELPLKKQNLFDIKKEEKLEDKLVDLTKLPKEQAKVKDLASEEILIEKDRPILKSEDITPLLNMEEVGTEAVSQKVLDLVEQVNKRNIVKGKDFSLDEKLVEKNLNNLEKKLSQLPAQPVIILSKETLEKVKLVDVPKVGGKTSSGSALFLSEAPTLKEEKTYVRGGGGAGGGGSRFDISNVRVVGKSDNVKIEDTDIIAKKKVTPIQQSLLPKKMLEADKSAVIEERKAEKKEKFEITGPLKNRKVEKLCLPPYPEWARNEGIEANVCLFFLVSPDGRVKGETIRIEMTSGYSKLDSLVMETLKMWKFVSLSSDAEQIDQWGYATFRYRLE